MSAGAYAWNVLVSAAITFAAACVVLLAARRPRFAPRPRLAVWLVALPFAKLAIEIARGVPAYAFFWDKIHGAVQEKGSFIIGLGISKFGPVVNFAFGARYHGIDRPQSAADGLATILDRHTASGVSSALGFVLAGVALALVVREIVTLARASIACRRHAALGEVVEVRRVGMRRALLVVSPTWHSVPFASGVLRPRICVSARVWSALSADEREAVVMHELAHLRWLDGPLLAFANLARAVLWFVPGAGKLLGALATQCEIAADADAVSRGVPPDVLASALVRTGELLVGPAPAPLLPLFRDEPTAFARRVQRLLAGSKPTRISITSSIVAILIALTVLRMTAFGNP